jgi:transposase
MADVQIARVDAIPILFTWLQTMDVANQIDAHWTPHREWEGVSYGQLAVLFLLFLIHERDHRLAALEPWVAAYLPTLLAVTGWPIRVQDATDDRLGHLLQVLGRDPVQATTMQQAVGRHLIRVYELPTEIARMDTTSFSVHHAPDPEGQQHPHAALLRFGYSQDKRPDLLQFKQALTTLDPGGVPLLSTTVPGNRADDPLYIPAWLDLVALLGHANFLFVADSKASALETRATLAHGGGRYLFPMPLTGEVPAWLQACVAQPPRERETIVLAPTLSEPDQPRTVGTGFAVARTMQGRTADGVDVVWEERWLVVQSTAYAERQQAAFDARVQKVEAQLRRIQPKATERAQEVQARVDAVLEQQGMTTYFTVSVSETAVIQRKKVGRGRPSAERPLIETTTYAVTVTVTRNAATIAADRSMLGWRAYVTNSPAAQLSLTQAMGIYREEWTVERPMHCWKQGALPVLPLFLQCDWRIRGLMQLFLIALPVLTLLEWQARRSLADEQATLAGLAPGNPKRATARPTATRMLAMCTNIPSLPPTGR